MSPFQSLRNYEEFIYTLKQRYPSIQRSTLIVVRRGKRTAVVQGEITFSKGYRIILKERLSFDKEQVVIESYGYELWRHNEKISWYDSQPHPNAADLASTYPGLSLIYSGIWLGRSAWKARKSFWVFKSCFLMSPFCLKILARVLFFSSPAGAI